METTKVTVIMEIEVEEFDLFMNDIPSGVIEFSKETGANILKTTVSEGYKIREYKKQIDQKERKLARAKKLLEKWLFFNGFNSALKKETEDFLGKKTEEIGTPEGVEEIKWQRENLKNS